MRVSLDSKDGAEFDVAILWQDMDIVSDMVVTDIGFELEEGDGIRVQYLNSMSRTVSVRLILV